MKFKIGDKVRIINCDISGIKCRYYNNIETIRELRPDEHYQVYLNNINEPFRFCDIELYKENKNKLRSKKELLEIIEHQQKQIDLICEDLQKILENLHKGV